MRILCEYSELLGAQQYPLTNAVPLSWRRYGSSSAKYRLESCNRHYEPLPFLLGSPNDALSHGPPGAGGAGGAHSDGGGGGGFSFSRMFRRFRSSVSSRAASSHHQHQQHSLEDQLDQSAVSSGNSGAHSVQQTPLARLHGDPVAVLSSDQSTWLTEEQALQRNQIVTPAVDCQGRQFSFARQSGTSGAQSRLPSRRDVHAATAHCLGRFPSWVYEMYDTVRFGDDGLFGDAFIDDLV